MQSSGVYTEAGYAELSLIKGPSKRLCSDDEPRLGFRSVLLNSGHTQPLGKL